MRHRQTVEYRVYFYPATMLSLLLQESLANAKVSARQQCVYKGP